MSLKAFHVFFILVCIVFALGFGWWAAGAGERLLAAVSFAAAPCLVSYLAWFIKSKKGLSP